MGKLPYGYPSSSYERLKILPSWRDLPRYMDSDWLSGTVVDVHVPEDDYVDVEHVGPKEEHFPKGRTRVLVPTDYPVKVRSTTKHGNAWLFHCKLASVSHTPPVPKCYAQDGNCKVPAGYTISECSGLTTAAECNLECATGYYATSTPTLTCESFKPGCFVFSGCAMNVFQKGERVNAISTKFGLLPGTVTKIRDNGTYDIEMDKMTRRWTVDFWLGRPGNRLLKMSQEPTAISAQPAVIGTSSKVTAQAQASAPDDTDFSPKPEDFPSSCPTCLVDWLLGNKSGLEVGKKEQ